MTDYTGISGKWCGFVAVEDAAEAFVSMGNIGVSASEAANNISAVMECASVACPDCGGCDTRKVLGYTVCDNCRKRL